MPSKYQIRRIRRHRNKYFHQYDTAKIQVNIPPGEKNVQPGKTFLLLGLTIFFLLSTIIFIFKLF